MDQHSISVEGSEARFACGEGESVLAAMLRAGREAAIEVGCRSGGCGVCRVEVLEGRYSTGAMSGAEVTPECRARGVALACQLFPESDLRVRAVGKRAAKASNEEFMRLFGYARSGYSNRS